MYGLVLIGTFNNELKKHSVSKIILTFHCSNELFQLCDLKNFVSSRSSALSLQKIFSITSTIFFTVGQNNFGNKIPIKFLKSIFHFDRKVKHFQKINLLYGWPWKIFYFLLRQEMARIFFSFSIGYSSFLRSSFILPKKSKSFKVFLKDPADSITFHWKETRIVV